MNLEIEVNSTSKVHISEIAGQFAEMNSTQQAVFLSEMFDALKFKCSGDFKFESQLSWIAISTKKLNLKDMNYVFDSLSYFLKDKE